MEVSTNPMCRCFLLSLLYIICIRLGEAANIVFTLHLNPPVSIASLQNQTGTLQSRRQNVFTALSEQSFASQRAIILFLRAISTEVVSNRLIIQPLWIQNAIIVTFQSAPDSIEYWFRTRIAFFPGIISIEKDSTLQMTESLPLPTRESELYSSINHNIQLLRAPELWHLGILGQHVTVASIDSGVRYTHETLAHNFRGRFDPKTKTSDLDYAFWVPLGTPSDELEPDNADLVGHGTHTMGIAVGGKGIGVAPNATWITARAFNLFGSVKKSDFLLATQWVICPTKFNGLAPDCHLGADIITNSFGISRTSAKYANWTWFDNVLAIWRKAGSIAVFASGNTNGFQCGSILYPACTDDAVAVGALVGGTTLWGASGKGPGDISRIKPDFVAPGVGIRSALSINDNTYTRLTGTSMATPHIAGSIALLLSAARSSQIDASAYDIVTILKASDKRDFLRPFLVPGTCGNTSYKVYPNNIYGWGMPDLCTAAAQFGLACDSDSITLRSLA